jgi:C4-type Zn-finger protein
MNIYDLISTVEGHLEIQRQIAHLSYCNLEDLNQRKFKSDELFALFSEIFQETNEQTILCLCDVLDIDLYDSLDIN